MRHPNAVKIPTHKPQDRPAFRAASVQAGNRDAETRMQLRRGASATSSLVWLATKLRQTSETKEELL